MGEQHSDPPPLIHVSPSGGDEAFEALVEELSRSLPEMKREVLLELVNQKKTKVGAGYLTNQGALFLVASDLGVALKPIPKIDSLSKIESDKGDLTIVARFLSIGVPKIFTRRADSSFGFVAKLAVFDKGMSTAISIWSKDFFTGLLERNLAPGEPIKLTGVYSKKSYDGQSISLSTTDKTEIVKLTEDNPSMKELPSIESRSIGLSEIEHFPFGTILIVKGRVTGPAKISDYTRKDASRGSFTSFSMSPLSGENGPTCRVVLWENPNNVFLKLHEGEEITLLYVRAKKSSFQGSEAIELHGDENSNILEYWEENKLWIETEFGSVLARLPKLESTKDSQGNSNGQIHPKSAFVARILSIGNKDNAGERSFDSYHALITDAGKRKILLTATDESLVTANDFKIDDVILCKPDTFDPVGLKASCSKRDSLSKVKPLREDIPKSNTLDKHIDQIESNSIVSIDCMVISVSPSREIQTKEGLVRRSEANVADPTGEIKLYAWRGLSRALESLAPGVRLWLHAVEAQSHEGKKFLVYKSYSRIEPST